MKCAFKYLAAVLLLCGVCRASAGPGLLITNLPAYGSYDNLGGMAYGVEPAACRVAVFIYVAGFGWVTKPTCAQALVPIASDGSWSADITTGGNDHLATRVAALLVSTNYNEPCVSGAATLPVAVYSRALASAVVTRQSSARRWVEFSGYNWWVKSSTGAVGPGPNYFSASTDNVWVDEQGFLHVRITKRSNQWQCAELVTARTFGYGTYRFELGSRVDNLNPNVVLGLFTWSDDPAYTHREIDIECARWGNFADPNNSQYTVQPSDLPNQLRRFAVPTGLSHSTHLFTWETNRVAYQSQRGSFVPNPAASNVITTWTFTQTVPQTGDENVRINLWLMSGLAPTDGQEVEIIIRKFEFVPLETPQPAVLKKASRAQPGQVRFTLDSQPDRRYAIQASADLSAWEQIATLLATNLTTDFTDSAATLLNHRYYRALTLP
ncbi:MAG TPA: glycoside hydrolase family 16 protein [Clostridia bacterium]|nr:glycoside hydrolase family 16 protein [Clostridia bacterium]